MTYNSVHFGPIQSGSPSSRESQVSREMREAGPARSPKVRWPKKKRKKYNQGHDCNATLLRPQNLYAPSRFSTFPGSKGPLGILQQAPVHGKHGRSGSARDAIGPPLSSAQVVHLRALGLSFRYSLGSLASHVLKKRDGEGPGDDARADSAAALASPGRGGWDSVGFRCVPCHTLEGFVLLVPL